MTDKPDPTPHKYEQMQFNGKWVPVSFADKPAICPRTGRQMIGQDRGKKLRKVEE